MTASGHAIDDTHAQLSAAFAAMQATIEAIRDAGQIPGGPLYAAHMATGMTLAAFEKMMGLIVGTGLVEKRGEVYVWVG